MIMFFIAHVRYWDEDNRKEKTQIVILKAENYIEATEYLCNHFGEKALEAIELLEPITDNSVVYINADAEKAIRDFTTNCFW